MHNLVRRGVVCVQGALFLALGCGGESKEGPVLAMTGGTTSAAGGASLQGGTRSAETKGGQSSGGAIVWAGGTSGHVTSSLATGGQQATSVGGQTTGGAASATGGSVSTGTTGTTGGLTASGGKSAKATGGTSSETSGGASAKASGGASAGGTGHTVSSTLTGGLSSAAGSPTGGMGTGTGGTLGTTGGTGGSVSTGGHVSTGGATSSTPPCSAPTGYDSMLELQDRPWLCGWPGGLDHYSWVVMRADHSTLSIVDADCPTCTPYFDCQGSGTYYFGAAMGAVVLSPPPACGVRSVSWTLKEVCEVNDQSYPYLAIAHFEVVLDESSLECRAYPPGFCNEDFTLCESPW